MNRLKRILLTTLVFLWFEPVLSDEVVVIGHAGIPALNTATIEKLFTGKVIEINDTPIWVVNLTQGNSVRKRFLNDYLAQDEEKYIAYWTVRKFIGKGSPPKELNSSAEVIGFVQSQVGAIGYVDATEVIPGLNIVSKKAKP